MKKFRKKFPAQPTSKFKSKLEEDFNDFLIQKKLSLGMKIIKYLTSSQRKRLSIRQILIVQQ